MTNRKCYIFCVALVFLTGCAMLPTRAPDTAQGVAVQKPVFPEYKLPRTAEGSLWSDMTGVALYPDMRARRVGDIVVVRIVEDPEAELKADTDTSRSSDIEAKLKLFGYMQALAGKNSRLAQIPGEDELIKATLGSSFKGQGSSNRAGYIKAYIATFVSKVLPNGNLYIAGERKIRVNNETQYITISGIIRPVDIDQANEIPSTYVADARITYSGKGALSDKQRPGWLGRIVDHAWPF